MSTGGDARASAATHITSRDNALLKELRRLSQDSAAYRRQGRIWLEGDHLCRAAMARGVRPAMAVFSESFWPLAPVQWAQVAIKNVVLTDLLMTGVSALESPARIAFVIDLPPAPALAPDAASVILDGVQDAGNVGSILRSAAAFGFGQIIALGGTAALWSPKVLRAGMGAHFALRLVERIEPQALDTLKVPVIVTSSHVGSPLQASKLPMPCAWALGHEGQGVSAALMARASLSVRIDQPGGEESLNVAAAAAICLHASAVACATGRLEGAAQL
ncbi:MAG TPA: RNA methyltransferase [Rhodoferax sp.]|nr:RNA methyltransferase [Rhodoferax sp.]